MFAPIAQRVYTRCHTDLRVWKELAYYTSDLLHGRKLCARDVVRWLHERWRINRRDYGAHGVLDVKIGTSITAAKVEQLANGYVADLKALSGATLDAKKSEMKSVQQALQYLAKWEFVPAGYAPKAALDSFIKSQSWDAAKK